MKNIKIEVTLEELLLITSLASDQLFRRQFIDPKMPGYKADPTELAMGKELLARLNGLARQAAGLPPVGAQKRAASDLPHKTNGIPDAV